jgi:hypothetical protein
LAAGVVVVNLLHIHQIIGLVDLVVVEVEMIPRLVLQQIHQHQLH